MPSFSRMVHGAGPMLALWHPCMVQDGQNLSNHKLQYAAFQILGL